MDVEESESPEESQPLQSLTNGSMSFSISDLSGSSQGIPSNKDFHFFHNFDQFRVPIQEITKKSQSMLESIGSNKEMAFPEDIDDSYDWLVDVNDEVFERLDMSVDEFRKNRTKEEETGKVVASAVDDGFQLVCGKKKKGGRELMSGNNEERDSLVKVATKDKKSTGPKPKVPFHIPTIRRPQEEFNIYVNNSNQPFEHVWLQRSEDGQRFIHPLEKLSVLDFVDKDISNIELVEPPQLERTPFNYVEEVKDLKDLASKLRGVNEFAVDLEHNQYRSFQGLTCLIQISTRTEDFVIDALKLRIHIGPYLREVFKDPTKKKVMHGADRDIVWLQRDFGIYICNLFDTGQASRVLKLERNSLEYLLHHFCGVTANKEYQNADWRLRPLPEEMLRYAREDTHYLFHIYDKMRIELVSMSKDSDNSNSLLEEVYKRSYDICMQLYEKELLTENSFLYVYGLQGAGLNAQQLAIAAGLFEWRDVVARAEDESTGYILPNKSLLEIAKQMPGSTSKLRRLVKSKHPYIEHNLASVVSIIQNSMENAAAFETAAEHLKEGRMGIAPEENIVVNDGPVVLKAPNGTPKRMLNNNVNKDDMSALFPNSQMLKVSSDLSGETGKAKIDGYTSLVPNENLTVSGQRKEVSTSFSDSVKVPGATVQVQKKPSRAFGALLGSTIAKKRLESCKKDKEEVKLEQIRSSVHFPFHSFSTMAEQSKPVVVEAPVATASPSANSNVENIIVLDDETDVEESRNDNLGATKEDTNLGDIIILDDETDVEEARNDNLGVTKEDLDDKLASASEIDEDKPMSLSTLSSSFEQCFHSANQNKKPGQVDKSQGVQLKPFDYGAARKQVVFGENPKEKFGAEGEKGPINLNGSKGKKSSNSSRAPKDDEMGEFSQGRRRKAFPATGNRSATFR
ncbi:hypothetical protein UlMin_006902 [Ulmus minor]